MSPHSSVAKTAEARGGFWVRHGGKFLLGLVLVIGLFGVGDLLFGLDADPAIPEGVAGMSPAEIRELFPNLGRLADLQVRAGGIQLIVVSTLWTFVLLVPFRQRERWAWWAMWTFPAWTLGVAVMFLLVEMEPGHPTPPPAISGWIFFVAASLLLLATRRGFRRPA